MLINQEGLVSILLKFDKVNFGGNERPFMISRFLYPKVGTSANITRFLIPESSALCKIFLVIESSAGWYSWNHALPSVIFEIFSIFDVETVLNMNGILLSNAAFANISGDFGQIRPWRPIGATPKGASYSIPNNLVLIEVSFFSTIYFGLSWIFLMSSVFLYKLSSLLHPPSKYSKANLGILFFAFYLK